MKYMKLCAKPKMPILVLPFILFFVSCSSNEQYTAIDNYLVNELQVDFDVEDKTYLVMSTHQCLPCVKKSIEIIVNTSGIKEGTKIIIGAFTKKKAFFLLPASITEKFDVIVDTQLIMENIPLFANNVFVKFTIQNHQIKNLVKTTKKDLIAL